MLNLVIALLDKLKSEQMNQPYSIDEEYEQSGFEKAEIDLLKEGLKRTYKERFLMATRLYKIQKTMEKAVITHKKFNKK